MVQDSFCLHDFHGPAKWWMSKTGWKDSAVYLRDLIQTPMIGRFSNLFPSLNFFSFSLAVTSNISFFLPYIHIYKLATNHSSHSQFNQSIHFCLFLWMSFLIIQTLQAFSQLCSSCLFFSHLFLSFSEPKSSKIGTTLPKSYTRRQVSSWLI